MTTDWLVNLPPRRRKPRPEFEDRRWPLPSPGLPSPETLELESDLGHTTPRQYVVSALSWAACRHIFGWLGGDE